MIHIRELADDYYEYDEENYCIKGRSTGKVYTLGDRVNIEVVKADLQKKQLDYRLVNNQQEEFINPKGHKGPDSYRDHNGHKGLN